VANRFWHAQAGSRGVRILKFIRETLPGFKRADDWRATRSLDGHHARPRWSDPTHLLHLIEGFPHPNQSGTAAGWINDHVRQMPIELLGQLVTHRLLAFDPIRLFQSRNVEPAFSFFSPPDFGATVSD